MTETITRRDLLTNRRKKAEQFNHIKKDWPTARVAKLYRKFLKDKPAPYYPPLKDYIPVPITPSRRHTTVDWNDDAAAHRLGKVSAGLHDFRLDCRDLSSGVYHIQVETAGSVHSQRVTLLK